MGDDSLQARIEHEVAELRGVYPRITTCHTALKSWHEDARLRYSLWLDIRWPQHQSIVSGAACDDAYRALRAGFDQARAVLAAGHA